MADPVSIDFGTQSDPGQVGQDTGPRHINAYVAEVKEGKHPYPFYCRDGLTPFSTVTGGGAIR